MKTRLAVVLVVLASSAGACQDGDQQATGGAPTPATTTTDEATAADVGGNGAILPTGVRYGTVSVTPAEDAEVSFDTASVQVEILDDPRGPEVAWSAGCNSISSVGTLEDGRLRLGELASTEIECAEPEHSREQWLTQFFLSEPTWEPRDGGVVLRSGPATIRLADPASRDSAAADQ